MVIIMIIRGIAMVIIMLPKTIMIVVLNQIVNDNDNKYFSMGHGLAWESTLQTYYGSCFF